MPSSNLTKVDWSIPHLEQLLLAVLIASLGVRILHAALYAIKLAVDAGWTWRRYGLSFRRGLVGFHPAENGRAPSTDYGYNFILGTIELCCYPIAIATGAWTAVGAWIAKGSGAVERVEGGPERIQPVLIGNAVNVIISVVLLSRFVSPA
jgi:hypothetical protein